MAKLFNAASAAAAASALESFPSCNVAGFTGPALAGGRFFLAAIGTPFEPEAATGAAAAGFEPGGEGA